jgi:formylglycine-generating enzyme required for sulfatase activity
LFDQSDFSLEHEMIEVQGGNFIMTKNDALIKSSNEQYESVPVSSFSIGKYEVTQAQWWSVMGNNPSCFGDCANCPVESVSWDDVQEFVQKLNLKTGKSYRLPTEAEWEYAAKGGVKTKGYLNYGANDLRPIAWCGEYTMSTHSVGTRQANELGIYDMSGNVSEWCSDSYLLKNYSSLALVRNHALRGCAWDYREYKCRAAYWLNAPSDAKSNCYGLRLVLPVSP